MKQENWKRLRKRYVPSVWPVSIYFQWINKKFDFSGLTHVDYWENGWLNGVWKKEVINQIGRYAFDLMSSEECSLDSLRDKEIKLGEKLLVQIKNFTETIKDTSVSDYIVFLENISEAYSEFMENNTLYWAFTQDIVEDELNQFLGRLDEQERKQIINTMSIPNELTFTQNQERDFRDLVSIVKSKNKNSELIDKAIKDFSSKYIWFPYEFTGPDIWDESRIRQLVEESTVEYKVFDIEETKNKQQRILDKYGFSDKENKLFKILRFVSILQDDRKRYNSEFCFYLQEKVLRKMSEKLNLDYDLVRYLDIDLLKSIENGLNVDEVKRGLQERSEGLAMVHEKNETKFFVAADFENLFLKNNIPLDSEEDNVEHIKGKTANGGSVKGVVKVLNNALEKEFNEGEVLVTQMTTPNFISLIKKCSAIITDEGGITCHAAIVSRELDKPCVIGTKVATQVLKDGMEVEVDADNGVVRIIK